MDEQITPHHPLRWQQEMRTAIKEDTDHSEVIKRYPHFIPRPLQETIHQLRSAAMERQFLPANDELLSKLGEIDPIGDHVHAQEGGLIHRYPHKALLLVTNRCAVNCRYCFRKNLLPQKSEFNLSLVIDYLRSHDEINEVILSGGDPLVFSDEKLLNIFTSIANIPHIKYARIHTRVPIVLPSRINQQFLQTLLSIKKLFKRFIMVIHINHSDELYAESIAALQKMTERSLECRTQSVLLKGVNDKVDCLRDLFEQLIDLNITPYYLHHPDPVQGGEHFLLSQEEGKQIYRELRKHLPSWATPRYVVEKPHGGGKINVLEIEQIGKL